jgi:hypothetical protein
MNWLKQLFSRRRRYDELSETIRDHLDEKIADLMDRGMTREKAERVASLEFGNLTRIEERTCCPRYSERSPSIQKHLEEKIANLMDHGMTPKDAERTACRDLNRALQGRELTRC